MPPGLGAAVDDPVDDTAAEDVHDDEVTRSVRILGPGHSEIAGVEHRLHRVPAHDDVIGAATGYARGHDVPPEQRHECCKADPGRDVPHGVANRLSRGDGHVFRPPEWL